MRISAVRAFMFPLVLTAVCWSSRLAAQESTAENSSPKVVQPEKSGEPISFVPLPVWATLPNEGATYGFMPVFLDNDAEGRIQAITAPSVTWNDVTHVTGTGRYFQFPNDHEERVFQASYGTRLYREAIVDWLVAPTEKGKFTLNASFNYRKDPFRRFFGLGFHSSNDDETSYTLEGSRGYLKAGYNLTRFINASVYGGMLVYQPQNDGVESIKKIVSRYADIPGTNGATTAIVGVGLRYDTRPMREYSTKGVLLDATLGGARSNVAKNGRYGHVKTEARVLWEEGPRVNGALRAHWSHVYGADIPFYERPSLGGSFLLRGFILDRFVDNAAWAMDFEQRVTALILRVEGSTVHVRIDPFVTVGQVYHHSSDMFEKVQLAPGLGIRAFSPPNVIGRVDVAWGGGTTNVFVELGYPF